MKFRIENFPPLYSPSSKEVDESQISDALGFQPEDIRSIKSLKKGKTWKDLDITVKRIKQTQDDRKRDDECFGKWNY